VCGKVGEMEIGRKIEDIDTHAEKDQFDWIGKESIEKAQKL
jgi:hypothetical protein